MSHTVNGPMIALALVLSIGGWAFAQQPQTDLASDLTENAGWVQGVGPGYWPKAGTALSAPSAPSLTAGTGGSLGIGTYWVKVTYVNVGGETGGSNESSVTFSADGGKFTVTSPQATTALNGNATGYNVYVTALNGDHGTETKQGGTTAIGTDAIISSVSTGSALPPANTTGLYANLTAGTASCNGQIVNYAGGDLAIAGVLAPPESPALAQVSGGITARDLLCRDNLRKLRRGDDSIASVQLRRSTQLSLGRRFAACGGHRHRLECLRLSVW